MHPTSHNTGPSASPLHSRLLDALLRFTERRALREMLELRSDRLLADAGFSRAQLAEQIRAAVEDSQQSRKVEQRVRRELSAYSDRELNDIGITRSDVPRLAREEAQLVLEARRLGRLGVQHGPQANDNAGHGAGNRAA